MSKQSRTDDYLAIEAMADSLKALCIKFRKNEEKLNKPVSVKKLLEQQGKNRMISRMRKTLIKDG